jgi:DinB family protein
VQASRLLASQLNSVNFQLHEVAGWMEPDDWLRRAVPGTNLPAFTFWHVARVIDSTVHSGIRGVPELMESTPWASKPWARPEVGTGYSVQEADELAAQVVPSEVLEYADAVRSRVSQWLRAITDEELEAPNALADRLAEHAAYKRPAARESIAPLVGQPVWLLLSITCFAHSWAHVEEIKLLTAAGRTARK